MPNSPLTLVASPTRESITQLSTTTSSPVDRYHAFASSGCQELICCICLETLKFPLSFPCQRHYACHKCIHELVNTHKQIIVSDQSTCAPPSAVFPIKCPMCRDTSSHTGRQETGSTVHTDCFLKTALVPQTGLLLSLVQLVNNLQSHLPANKRLKLPLIDDVSCPYCKKAFHPQGSYGERYEHLANCPERKYSCPRCNTWVTCTDLSRHLVESCATHSCPDCEQTGLVWSCCQDHGHRTSESNLRARHMQNMYMTASRYARLSHHDDWPQLSLVLSHTCETAIKHRKVVDRIDKIILEYLKLQRSLEQLDRVWSEQDAVRMSRS